MTISEGLEMDYFANIRSNRNTKLPNQMMALNLLDSTETALKNRGLAFTPENYFQALWPLLDNEVKEHSGTMNKATILDFNIAIAYLASFVAPRLSGLYIEEHYSEIYAKIVSTAKRFTSSAPIMRSLIVIIEATLVVFTNGNVQQWRQSCNDLLSLLEKLLFDLRPKVRKLAQDALSSFLQTTNSTLSTIRSHVFDFVLIHALKPASRREAANALHAVAFLEIIFEKASAAVLLEFIEHDQLVHQLCSCAALGNTYLSLAIFKLFELVYSRLFQYKEELIINHDKLAKLLLKISALRPDPKVINLVIPWLSLLSKTLLLTSKVHDLDEKSQVEHIASILLFWELTDDEQLYLAVGNALRMVFCLIADDKKQLSSQIVMALLHLLQRRNFPACLHVVRSIGDLCRESGLKTMPVELLRGLANIIEASAIDKVINEAEQAVGSFISQYGCLQILEVLPIVGDREGNVSNTWLLPIIRDHTSHAPLEVFIKQLIPQADYCLQRSQGLGKLSDMHQLYQRLHHQIWACLPSFLTFPTDFSISFPILAPILGKQLNESPSLRVIIVTAITSFINRHHTVESCDIDGENFELDKPVDDLKVLAGFAKNFVPILLNIYAATPSEQREYLFKGIRALISLLDASTIEQKYLNRVLDRLPQAKGTELLSLLELVPAFTAGIDDINIHQKAFLAILPIAISRSDDTIDETTQKRAYRVLGDLLNREDFLSEASKEPFFNHLEQTFPSLLPFPEGNGAGFSLEQSGKKKRFPSGIRKARLRLSLRLVSGFLPLSHMHWVVLLLPEILSAIKDNNNQTRLYGFELLLALARRCSIEKIKSSSLEAEAQTPMILSSRTRGIITMDMPCNFHSLFSLLLTIGLCGQGSQSASPNRISATIMAVARLVFEFKEACMNEGNLDALVSDIIDMLQSRSREVIKSVLGFVKVIIGGALPLRFIENHLPLLVKGLFIWSGEHHQCFKVRVRHIMERLVKKFGYGRIYELAPLEHRKLLANIKKRRERAKRHKDALKSNDNYKDKGAISSDDDSLTASCITAISRPSTRLTALSAAMGPALKASTRFESVINDSESELSDSDNDEEDYTLTGDSILNDIRDLDDSMIEKVLKEKLSLASSTKKRQATTSPKRINQYETEEIAFDKDGRMLIPDPEAIDEDDPDDFDDDDNDSDDNQVQTTTLKNKKRVSFKFGSASAASKTPAKLNNKRHHGDAKRRQDKFEPYSYVPMARSETARSSSLPRKNKGEQKYYLKRL